MTPEIARFNSLVSLSPSVPYSINFWGHYKKPETENEYVAANWPQHLRQNRIVCLVACLAFFSIIFADWQAISDPVSLNEVILIRTVVLVTGLLLFFYKPKQVSKLHLNGMFFYSMLYSLGLVAVIYIHNPDHQLNLIDLFTFPTVILSIYFFPVIPSKKIIFSCTLATLTHFAMLIFIFSTPFTELVPFVMSLVTINVLGSLNAISSNARNRRRFVLLRQLEESEARYRLVSENSQDFIALHRPDGTYEYVSPSVKELLGYEPEELMGISGFSLIHPDDINGIMEGPRKEALRGQVVLNTQFRMKKKDTGYLWVEAYANPILDEKGNVIHVQTSIRDITARKLVEEKLAESERLYRLISTNSKDLISLYKAEEDPKRIFASPSCKEIMGYEPEELVGRSPFDFIVPEDAEEMRKEIHPITMSGHTATKEYRARKKDGSIIWLETISNPFFDEQGRVSGFQTSARDITARKLVEEKLAESERLYRLISMNSKDMMSLYKAEKDHKRIYVSPSCKSIMGYEPEEMIGRSPYDFILPEDVKEIKETTEPLTFSGQSATKEYRAWKKDGTIIWLESITNPYFDEDGNMIGFQSSARDITLRKKFEQELLLAKEKSEQISNQLLQLLQEKNDLVGLFSHDMRSPINQIKGLAQVMLMSIDDKEFLKDSLLKLDQTANRQLALYTNVLYMLKSDHLLNKIDLFEKTKLNTFVNKVGQNLDWEMTSKKVKLSTIIPETLEVNIDIDLFTHALHNIFVNAIKFSLPGGTIKVTAEESQHSIIVTIKDQGIGFDPAKAEILFDRFTKEGRKGTNNESSTGLGLSLVKKIVEIHHGTIRAKSEGEGTGASFIIQLPKG